MLLITKNYNGGFCCAKNQVEWYSSYGSVAMDVMTNQHMLNY